MLVNLCYNQTPFSLDVFIFLFCFVLFNVPEAFVYTMSMPSTQGQKSMLDPLGLELQIAVSNHGSPGTESGSSVRAANAVKQ